MAYSIKVLPGRGLCLFGYSGKLTQADFDGVWRELGACDFYRPEFDDLVVIGPDADYSDFQYAAASEEAERYARVRGSMTLQQAKRTAVICATDMQVVVTRMFAAYLKANSPSLVAVECFRDLGESIDWLEAKDRPRDRDEIETHLRAMGHNWCCSAPAA